MTFDAFTRLARTALLGAALAAAGVAQAQTQPPPSSSLFAQPEEAVAYRQAVFRLTERHYARLHAASLGRAAFDAPRAELDAHMVALLAKLPFHAFVPGTDEDAVDGSRARPLVWSASTRFHESAAAYQAKADALPAAVRAGDLKALKALMIETGSICRKCHDQFRRK